ncbi:hypothetical protein MAR_016794 [Mya arenaria]|uniref:Uncharacterized protein n=1 Tax=Mya arenaria TaxID=6604 RepID=A0ABY7EI37_MYAAR|nr:uncharacterized protein LOC128236644 [Mya arenaria]WAR06836.1 hypothetical protein MAR_016794 [Mya arenaria]
MTEFRELLFVLVNLCFLTEADGCTYSSNNEINICNAGTLTGTEIGIRNNNVPNDTLASCVCDIQAQSQTNITVFFDGPGYTTCGTKLYLQKTIYSCKDGSSIIGSETNRLTLKKSYTFNDEWCMLLRADIYNMAITCYGINEELPELKTVSPVSTSASSVSTTQENSIPPSLSSNSHRTTSTSETLTSAISELPSTLTIPNTSTTRITTTSLITSSLSPKSPASDSTSGTVPRVTTGNTQTVSHIASVTASSTFITTKSYSVGPHSNTTPTNTTSDASRTAAKFPKLAIVLISAVCGILLIATVIAIIVHVVRKRGPNYNQKDTEDAINDSTSNSVINAYNPRHSSAITNPMNSNLDVARKNNDLSSFHVESSPTYASINKNPGPNYENTFPTERSNVRSTGIKFKSSVPEAVDDTQESGTSDLYAVVNKPGSNQDNKDMHSANTQVGPMKGILKNQTGHRSDNVNRFDKAEENGAVKFNNDHMPNLEQYPGDEKYTTDSDEDMDTINPNYIPGTSEMSTAL